MIDVSNPELLLLLLYDRVESTPPTVDASVEEMASVLDRTGGTLAGRIELVSSVHDLREKGLLQSVGAESSGDGTRTRYRLTETGASRAAAVREDVASTQIEVRTGEDRRTMALEDAAERFETDGLVQAIQRLSDDGVLWIGSETDLPEFVNRTQELERALNAVESVRKGNAQTLAITGEAGIGKTAFVDRLVESTSLTVARGRAFPDRQEPFGAFRGVLEAEDASPFRERREPIQTTEDFESQRSSLFHDIAVHLESEAADQPLVLAIDDLHLADRASLDLATHLVSSLDGSILFVTALRTGEADAERIQPLLAAEDVERIELERFDRSTTARLVESVLETTDVPGDFVDAVYESTGGNPLFVEETVMALTERDAVDPRHRLYPESPSDFPIPDGIEAILETRLDGLEADGIAVLERSAVIGVEFQADVLFEISPGSSSRVLEYLDALVTRNVLERVGESTLRFQSEVIHSAILDSIPPEREETVHEAIARALTSTPVQHEHGEIATHFEAAGLAGPAIAHYRAGGQQAMLLNAHDVAREYYERALELARETERGDVALELLEQLGHLTYVVGEIDDAKKYFQYVREHETDGRVSPQVIEKLSRIFGDTGDSAAAIDLIDSYLADHEDDLEDGSMADLIAARGFAHQLRSEQSAAIDDFRTIETIARENDDRELEGQALAWRAGALRRNGQLEAALEVATTAVDKLEATDDRATYTEALDIVGIIRAMTGDRDAAEAAFMRTLDVHEDLGKQVQASMVRTNLATLYREMGRLERSLELYEESIESARRLGNDRTLALAFLGAGKIHLLQGDLDVARDYLERNREYVEDAGDTRFQVYVTAALSWWYHLSDRQEKARNLAGRTVEIAAELDAPDIRAHALERRGLARRHDGKPEAALSDHVRGYRLARKSGVVKTVGMLDCALAETLLALDRPEEALARAKIGRKRLEEYSLGRQWVRITHVLGECHAACGNHEAATEYFQESLADARALPSVVHECECLVAFGDAENRRGNDERARELYAEGRDLARESDIQTFEDLFCGRME